MPRSTTALAESFRATYERRAGREPHTGSAHDVAGFRECVLAKIGRLTPKQTARIVADVRDDWGREMRRRVERTLRVLLEAGEVRRTDDGWLLVAKRRVA